MSIANQVNSIQAILGKNKVKNHEGRRKPRQVTRHLWSIADEQLAIHLYSINANMEMIKEAIANTEIKLASMLMKIKNIQYLDTGVGLENVSDMTRALWEQHKQSELFRLKKLVQITECATEREEIFNRIAFLRGA